MSRNKREDEFDKEIDTELKEEEPTMTEGGAEESIVPIESNVPNVKPEVQPASIDNQADMSLKVMGLTPQQKMILLEDGLSKILNSTASLPMGRFIPTVIPEEGTPAVPSIYALMGYSVRENGPPIAGLIEIDFRRVESAWNYYTKNADKPTQLEFIALIQKVSKKTVKVYQQLGLFYLK